MRHLDDSELVLLALGEPGGSQTSAGHPDGCADCRSRLEELREVVGLGAESRGLRELPPPPDRVWQAIAAQVDPRSAGPLPEGHTGVRPAPPAGGDGASRPGDGRSDSRRPRSPRPRAGRRVPGWLRTGVVAGLAAVLAGAGTWASLGSRPAAPVTPPAAVAQARLSAFGTTPVTATGVAEVGTDRRLRLTVAGLPPVDGYYGVWLIDPDTALMFPVGVLGDDPDGTYGLPSGIDLKRYRVVDVSAEQFDGKPAHSGDSLLRGTLADVRLS